MWPAAKVEGSREEDVAMAVHQVGSNQNILTQIRQKRGQLDVQQATSEYLKCVEDTPFLEES